MTPENQRRAIPAHHRQRPDGAGHRMRACSMQVAAILVRTDPSTEPPDTPPWPAACPLFPDYASGCSAHPFGCGRPIWVDDADFTVDRHIIDRTCPGPETNRPLMKVAVTAATTANRPLWSITLVNGLEGGRTALVLVIHHVLADGIGGLAALALLVDRRVDPEIPFPTGTTTGMPADRNRLRIRALRPLVRLMRDAVAELGRGHVGRPTRPSTT